MPRSLVPRIAPTRDKVERPRWHRRPIFPSLIVVTPTDGPILKNQNGSQGIPPEFQRDSSLNHVSVGPVGGTLVDYHRVGKTHQSRCPGAAPAPWPLSWIPRFR